MWSQRQGGRIRIASGAPEAPENEGHHDPHEEDEAGRVEEKQQRSLEEDPHPPLPGEPLEGEEVVGGRPHREGECEDRVHQALPEEIVESRDDKEDDEPEGVEVQGEDQVVVKVEPPEEEPHEEGEEGQNHEVDARDAAVDDAAELVGTVAGLIESLEENRGGTRRRPRLLGSGLGAPGRRLAQTSTGLQPGIAADSALCRFIPGPDARGLCRRPLWLPSRVPRGRTDRGAGDRVSPLPGTRARESRA